MSWTRSSSAFSLAFQQSTLPPRSAHPYSANIISNTARLPGGHPTLRPTYAMGRLDRASGYNPHHRLQRRHLRHA